MGYKEQKKQLVKRTAEKGEALLEAKADAINGLEIFAPDFENSKEKQNW